MPFPDASAPFSPFILPNGRLLCGRELEMLRLRAGGVSRDDINSRFGIQHASRTLTLIAWATVGEPNIEKAIAWYRQKAGTVL